MIYAGPAFLLITRQGAGGGISISEGYKIDKSLLTKDELQSILIGLKSLESVGGASNIDRLLDKLTMSSDAIVSLRDSLIIDMATYYKESLSQKIFILRTVIAENKKVVFSYFSDKGNTLRTIDPYFILFKWFAWYVFGICQDKNDFRLFKLNRLWELTLTE